MVKEKWDSRRWTRLRDATALRWERKIGTDFSSPYIKAGGWVWFSFGEPSPVFRSPPPTPPHPEAVWKQQGVGSRGGSRPGQAAPAPRTYQGIPGLRPRPAASPLSAPEAPTNHRRVPGPRPAPPRRGLPALPSREASDSGPVMRVSGSLGDGGRVTPGAPARGTHLAAGRGRRPEDRNVRGPRSRQTGATSSNTSCSDVTGHVGRGLKGTAGLKGAAGPDVPAPARTDPGENAPVCSRRALST